MVINHYQIKNFRNIEYDFGFINGDSIIISGQNKIGKTNLMNALYWCLTGVDLDNNCDNTDILKQEGFCEVILDMDVGSIERKLWFDGKKYTQYLRVNKENVDISKGEAVIDNMLGILPLTLLEDKEFKVRRFLMNPKYVSLVKPAAMRNFIVRNLNIDGVCQECANKLSDTAKKLLTELKVADFNIDGLSKTINDQKKDLKKQIDEINIGVKFLKELNQDHEIFKQNSRKGLLLEKLARVEQAESAFKELLKLCLLKFEEIAENYFGDIDVKFIEFGQNEGVYSSVCYPVLPDSKLPLSNGSTSEKTLIGARFVQDFKNNCSLIKYAKFPIFIDELESIDKTHFEEFKQRVDTQIFATKVTETKHRKVERM